MVTPHCSSSKRAREGAAAAEVAYEGGARGGSGEAKAPWRRRRRQAVFVWRRPAPRAARCRWCHVEPQRQEVEVAPGPTRHPHVM